MNTYRTIEPNIGLLPVIKPREYAANIPDMLTQAKAALTQAGAKVSLGETVDDEAGVLQEVAKLKNEKADLVLFLVGTWILAPQIVTAANELNIPFTIWSLTTIANFALGGATVAKYTLQEMGVDFGFVAGLPSDQVIIDRIIPRARAAAVVNRIRHAKIGEIGGKSMGMYNATIDEFYWKRAIGVDLPHYDTYQVIKLMDAVNEKEVAAVLETVKNTVGNIVREVPETEESLNDDDLRVQIRMYLALRKLVETEALNAIGNKCQPELSSSACGLGWAACLAHALLNDNGIMCSCEADMPSAITMYILNLLSGQPVFFADLNSVERSIPAVRFINCGSGPLTMAKCKAETVLWPVPVMMGYPGTSKGATTSFTLKPGKVTVAKLGGGKDTARIHFTTGTVLDRTTEPKGEFPERWPQALIKLDTDMDEFLEKAIGQHYLIIYGDWTVELLELCKIWRIKADYIQEGGPR
jgi:L-fucose isomerase-like protein